MSERIDRLARRVENDPFFLASLLKVYRESENLGLDELAARLGCAKEVLPMVALCRRPAATSPQFRRDVDRIAGRFGLSSDVLGQIVRQADALTALRPTAANEAGLLMAARDGEPTVDELPGDDPQGGSQ